MSWTRADAIDLCDEVADYTESFDPSEGEVVQGVEYLLIRAARRRSVDAAELAESVAEARAAGTTWARIGEILGLDAAVAEQRYGHQHDPQHPAGRAQQPTSRADSTNAPLA